MHERFYFFSESQSLTECYSSFDSLAYAQSLVVSYVKNADLIFSHLLSKKTYGEMQEWFYFLAQNLAECHVRFILLAHAQSCTYLLC